MKEDGCQGGPCGAEASDQANQMDEFPSCNLPRSSISMRALAGMVVFNGSQIARMAMKGIPASAAT
jgi:hypothetical protein